jgi:hypothetical protein
MAGLVARLRFILGAPVVCGLIAPDTPALVQTSLRARRKLSSSSPKALSCEPIDAKSRNLQQRRQIIIPACRIC